MYVDEKGCRCSNNAIASHTLQNSGALKAIAENGHVYQLGADMYRKPNSPLVKFNNLGKSKASIFPGFCKKHDNDLFQDIEGHDPQFDLWAIFLLSYRVICLEMFAKERNVEIFSNPELSKHSAENGNTAEFEAFLEGTKLGLSDLARAKKEYENALHSRDLSGFTASGFILEYALPFCFATPFAPEFDLQGNPLLPRDNEPWHTVGMFAGRFGKKDIVVVGGFENNRSHDISAFVNSFSKILDEDVGDIAFNIAIEFAENSFYRKSWIDSFSEEQRTYFSQKFQRGIPGIKSEDTRQLHLTSGLVNVPARHQLKLCD